MDFALAVNEQVKKYLNGLGFKKVKD